MLRNYLKIAFRNLLKDKIYSLINIIGLTIGFGCFIILGAHIYSETSFDKFHNDGNRIYRVLTIDEGLGVSNNLVGITNPLMTVEAAKEIPEIEESTRLMSRGRIRVENKEKYLYANDTKYAEESFFRIFNFNLKEGSDVNKFQQPKKAFLTESFSKKLFDDENSIGKSFNLENETWEVVGIVDEDTPQRSHINFDMLLSFSSTSSDSSRSNFVSIWRSLGMIGYVKLIEGANREDVQSKMNNLAHSNDVPDYWLTNLQPVEDAHLKSSDVLFDFNNYQKGDITNIGALAAVGMFILLIAAFNFMNLSTAKSASRAKEVGIRKVIGSSRRSLIIQHLSEAVLMSILALLISAIFTYLIAPQLSILISRSLLFEFLGNWPFAILIVGIAILIGLLSGLYPAMVLSSFRPVNILRGKFQTGKKGIQLRKGLVVIQFIASISLILCALFVNKQLRFINNKDLGFSRDQVVTIQMEESGLRNMLNTFKQSITQFENVSAVSTSSNMPGRGLGRRSIIPEGSQASDANYIVSSISIDEDFFNVLDMKVKEGRNFSKEYGTDEVTGAIVNESFVAQFGWDDPIGKKITIANNNEVKTIIGVVTDFHYASLRHSIEPIMLLNDISSNDVLSIRLSGNIKEGLNVLERQWRSFFPEYPFEYQFLDDEFEELYRSDKNFAELVKYFTIVSVLIASIGLFGLSTFIAEQRKKEIGIRKVLGASLYETVSLLSKEFIVLILIAISISGPIAYYSILTWIENFQYRIDLISFESFILFLSASIISLLIGFLSVGYKSFKAATKNPSEVIHID